MAVAYTGWDTSLSGVTHEYFATSCSDLFRGPVISDDGAGNVVARIDMFTMSCDQGVTVVDGIDVNISTTQGTCRYTGPVSATAMDQGYFMDGTLTRQSTGCGGDAQVQINDPFEVFGV